MEQLTELLIGLGERLAYYGLKLIGALLILIIGFKLIKWLRNSLGRKKSYISMDVGVRSFISSLIGVGLKAFVIISAAAVMGFPMASVVAFVGTIGVAIGLALQGSLGNLASGVVILINKPFTIGDYITVGAHKGRVQDIGFFYISLVSDDSQKINIPNSKITNDIIINSSAFEKRRLDLELSVETEDDTDAVKTRIIKDIKTKSRVLSDPEPRAIVTEKSGNTQSYRVEVWIAKKDYDDAATELKEYIKIKYSK